MNKNHSINIRITEKEKELLEVGARKHGYQSVSSYLRPKFAFLAEMEDWDSFALLSRLSAISGKSEAETLFRSLLFVAKQKGLTVDMYEE